VAPAAFSAAKASVSAATEGRTKFLKKRYPMRRPSCSTTRVSDTVGIVVIRFVIVAWRTCPETAFRR
jgi:hypothetical protein